MTAGLKIALLVNGGEQSIEAVRARELSRDHPARHRRILYREGARGRCARNWLQAIHSFQPDLLYVINTAQPGIAVAGALRTWSGLPYILDTGDAVYRMALSTGLAPAWKTPLIGLAEVWALRSAAGVVVRGTEHAGLLRDRGLDRVSVIPDGFLPHPRPSQPQPLRRQLGLEGRVVIGLMGSLVYCPRPDFCYGWDLLEALTRLQDLPVKGLVIGDGDGRKWLETRARQLGVEDRICFVGRVPYAKVPEYLRLMDFAVSTQTNDIPGRVRTTGKLPEYMAAGRFILATRVGEAARVLPEAMLLPYEGTVDRSHPERLAGRIREWLPQTAERRRMGRALVRQAEERFGYEHLRNRWTAFVARVARDTPPR